MWQLARRQKPKHLHYTHIALKKIRRIDIQWEEKDVEYFDELKKVAKKNKIELPQLIKEILSRKS